MKVFVYGFAVLGLVSFVHGLVAHDTIMLLTGLVSIYTSILVRRSIGNKKYTINK